MFFGVALRQLKTEQGNSRARNLEQKSTLEILRIVNHEDARVALAVRRELPRIARAVDAIVRAFRAGGRLFYIGAGTSGRLAVLDAAECPPTFGTPPRMVQALIAGGRRAMFHAVEGAEDSAVNGARDLAKAGLTRRDAVVGIAASGTTPYVLGGLRFAKRRGAATIALTSNPKSPLARLAQIPIAPATGPEVLTGSTRMKAGTAQKMVLNMLSTTSMARLGRVYEGRMIYVMQTNKKLRRRGEQILEETAGVSASTAQHTLRQTGHNLPLALVMLKARTTAARARQLLRSSRGDVRQALNAARLSVAVPRRRSK